MTGEYQALFEDNLKDFFFNDTATTEIYTCLSPGMPRATNGYGEYEFVVTPDTFHILIQHIDDEDHTALLGVSGRGYALAMVAGTGALSPPQVDGLASIYAEGHRRYGWPLTVAHAPGEAGLLSHGSGGLSFAAHPDCPGPDLMRSLDAVVACIQGLLDPATAVPTAFPTNTAGQAEPEPGLIAAAPEDGGSPEPELISVAPQTRQPLAAEAGWGRRWLPHLSNGLDRCPGLAAQSG